MFTINDLRRYCDERRLNKIEKGFRNEEVYGYTYDDTDYPTITITGGAVAQMRDSPGQKVPLRTGIPKPGDQLRGISLSMSHVSCETVQRRII